MPIRQFEIYVIPFAWGSSEDVRPVIVVSPQWYLDRHASQDVLVAPLSSSLGLYDETRHFRISKEHPDFGDSGLKKECYVAVDRITFVPRRNLPEARGELEGKLRGEFKEFLIEFLDS